MSPSRPAPLFDWFVRWLDEPLPILRLELVRILAPLATLGFLSGRIAHADEWLGDAGFRVPEIGGDDYRQPFYLPALPSLLAWGVAFGVLAAGLCLSAGYKTRRAAGVFAVLLAYVALADRLAAFTVTKLSPAVAFALFLSPCGTRFGLDAWLRARRTGATPMPPPDEVSSGSVRFFQAFLVVMYTSSGLCKVRGEWLTHMYVLWTHVHDSYQTPVAWFLANQLPAPLWTVLQLVVLALELFAPLWFSWKKTRPVALVLALGMHAMIGLMFGPVKWFALLMIALLLGSYVPDELLRRACARLSTLEDLARRRAR